MLRISGIKLRPSQDEGLLRECIIKELRLDKISWLKDEDFNYRIIKKSVDARKKPDIFYIYSVAVSFSKETEERYLATVRNRNVIPYEEVLYKPLTVRSERVKKRPVITGDGPCGIFCAYILTLGGLSPIVLERGGDIDERTESVDEFFGFGKLNKNCNVQFGEGGAGAFSDGKLNTMVKDKMGRDRFVLETFVKYGAPKDTLYAAKPHLGTDRLRSIMKAMRSDMERMGCEFRFNTCLLDIAEKNKTLTGVMTDKGDIDTDTLILAIGHSSRDTFKMLDQRGLNMVSKPFAAGFRLEHSQKWLDDTQYGKGHDMTLPAADYKVTNTTDRGRAVYSFCMCPGGYVVNSSSEENRLCINGMSYSKRDGKNCNSAIVAAVSDKDYGNSDPLCGMEYQRVLEEKAYEAGEGEVPVMNLSELLDKRFDAGSDLFLLPCIKGRYKKADILGIFGGEINDAIISSIEKWDRQIAGFADRRAVISAVESRTSSPVRILRNEGYESNIRGIFPAGEGAGYAGGIMSAAMDGIRMAEKVIEHYND
ncbi:MAG: FAD-dependent oxidoreductase [Lachnospiraceae bacterium]|nr:FAD-dependent oxidoreductase [Lachnospiraceae bacterium]